MPATIPIMYTIYAVLVIIFPSMRQASSRVNRWNLFYPEPHPPDRTPGNRRSHRVPRLVTYKDSS